MPLNTLDSLDFSRFFTLCREGVPDVAVCYVRDSTGAVVARDSGDGCDRTDSLCSLCDDFAVFPVGLDRSMRVGRKDGRVCYSMAIFTSGEEFVGSLSVALESDASSETNVSDAQVERLLGAVVLCIEKELRLTTELEAMTQELVGRYEELNLVFENSDEDLTASHDSDIHKKLVEDYVEYLGVDKVALVFPSQGRIFGASGRDDPIADSYDVVRQIAESYMPLARKTRKCLLVNNFSDPMRRELDLGIPYKILACPVLNSRGGVEGLLMCLNHLYRTDFYNSDKNLLSVMARKAAKVLNAHYDALTGLNNQQAFKRMLDAALETATGQGLTHCLLNIDLSNLRVINDSLGREAGDAAIRRVALAIKDNLRNSDALAYLGEGHYGVLLQQCAPEQGENIAENLRSVVADNPLQWNDRPVDLKIAVGLALIEPHTQDIDGIVEAAEIARDSAKELGHVQIQTYRQNDAGLVYQRQRMQWVARIQDAMRENRFRVYCQVIEPTSPSDEAYHFEVLLRLLDDRGEIVKPEEFIPPAEQYNLMPTLDRWVIENTFKVVSENALAQHSGEGMVSINLSGQSLGDGDLPNFIATMLDEFGIKPDCISFEITETVAFRDMDLAVSTMNAIKSLGCHLSLDDFGTGLSTFTYLKELPVDYLKIDGSFVRNILEDRISHAMVAAINQIGHVMGLKTVAEFVENDAIRDRLIEMRIDYLQGYAIARPVPLEEYLAELKSGISASAGQAS